MKDAWKKYSSYFIDFWHGQCPVDIEPACAMNGLKTKMNGLKR